MIQRRAASHGVALGSDFAAKRKKTGDLRHLRPRRGDDG